FVGERFEAITFEQLISASSGRLPRQTLERCKVGDHRPRLHLLVKTLLLGQISQTMPDRERGRMTQDRDRSTARFDDLEDHPERGRLARAVRPQEPTD